MMLDMHSHILPCLDDGPENEQESFLIIKGLMELGFSTFIMTPHFIANIYDNTRDKVMPAVDALRNQIQTDGMDASIFPGNEVFIDSVFKGNGVLNDFCPIGEKEKTTMLEVPFHQFDLDILFQTVFDLSQIGVGIVIAHPERAHEIKKRPACLDELMERGVKLQINLLSLIGYYGEASRRLAEDLLSREKVFGVGTDIHRLSQLDRDIPMALDRLFSLAGRSRIEDMMELVRFELGFKPRHVFNV